MDAMVKPLRWGDMPPDMVTPFKLLRTPVIGWFMVSVGNMFLKKMLPDMIVRKLSKEEVDYYNAPFQTIASRKPVRVWPMEIPINGKPERMHKLMASYADWLKETKLPMLCLYFHPGAIIRESGVEYIKKNFKNTKMVDIGKGLHFVQEDHPHEIGEEISKWYKGLK